MSIDYEKDQEKKEKKYDKNNIVKVIMRIINKKLL
jgi:hypothetical protein